MVKSPVKTFRVMKKKRIQHLRVYLKNLMKERWIKAKKTQSTLQCKRFSPWLQVCPLLSLENKKHRNRRRKKHHERSKSPFFHPKRPSFHNFQSKVPFLLLKFWFGQPRVPSGVYLCRRVWSWRRGGLRREGKVVLCKEEREQKFIECCGMKFEWSFEGFWGVFRG